jgi:phenylalanyl-tRNA synthetase beta chain
MLEIAGGKAASGVIDEKSGLKPLSCIAVNTGRINALLGADYSSVDICRSLQKLGCVVATSDNGISLNVTPPFWRSDINIEADVIEEVARICGYDSIPITMLSKSIPHQTPNPVLEFKRRLREGLCGLGFYEILSWTMTSTAMLKKALNQTELEIQPLYVKKPMSVEQECLRTSLRPGLLSALASNRRFEDEAIKLFELGAVYLPRTGDLPAEPQILAGLITSSGTRQHWSADPPKADFFAVKGIVEGLLSSMGVTAVFELSQDNGFKPGLQAMVIVDDRPVGVLGEIHPAVSKALDINEPVLCSRSMSGS